MSSFLKKLNQLIAPVIGIALFCVLFVIGIVVFSYLLIFIAALGFVIFCIAFVRAKMLQKKMAKQYKNKTEKSSSGRVIDYNDIEKK